VKKIARGGAYLCFLAAFVLFLYSFRNILNHNYPVTIISRTLFTCIVCVLVFIGGAILSLFEKQLDRVKQGIKVTVMVIFVYYLFQMILLLFFDPRYRNVSQEAGILDFFEDHNNLIPFKTILEFFRAFRNGVITRERMLINVFGNIIAFIPLGLLAPVLYKPLRKFAYFLLSTIFTLFLVETMQVALRVGSFDVDDLLLNFIGVLTGYLVILLILGALKLVLYRLHRWTSLLTSSPGVAALWQGVLERYGEDASSDRSLDYLLLSKNSEVQRRLVSWIAEKEEGCLLEWSHPTHSDLQISVDDCLLVGDVSESLVAIIKITGRRNLLFGQLKTKDFLDCGYQDQDDFLSQFSNYQKKKFKEDRQVTLLEYELLTSGSPLLKENR
jgi:glycopeptide antibiotics resistance protein